ncbi:MAG: ASKHA domain-containing protein [Erysipelotrichaceae bacterium]|nr:ASKHA domain-containing protein [Erysipelotrichaceae bacterium]
MNIKKGSNLLEEVRTQGALSALCNGRGMCCKCKVQVNKALPLSEIEIKLLSPLQINQNIRLACQHPILEEDVHVSLVDKENMVVLGLDRGHVDIKKASSELLLAIDLGTTTVVMVLIDGKSGEVLLEHKLINPQRTYGADVLSRIEVTLTHNDVCHRLIKNEVKKIVEDMVHRYPSKSITIGITGNTTMSHLWLNADVRPLVQLPYRPSVSKQMIQSIQAELGIDVEGNIIVYPPIAAYLGSDILAGMSLIDLFETRENIFFIDLGTNGEIVLVSDGQLYATSTAAGPAFEGVNMSSGCGAVDGAMDHFFVSEGKINYTTINEGSPIGICGSGYIDLISCLLDGPLESSGFLMDEVVLHDDPRISITQKDIREFQLAKAAIRSGMDMCLIRAGISYDQLDSLIIAGGFGKHINLDAAINIGLIPKECKDNTLFIGNSSLAGCVSWLSEEKKVPSQWNIESIKVIELASSAKWLELFSDHMMFEGGNL